MQAVMTMKKPQYLFEGARVAILAPSSPVPQEMTTEPLTDPKYYSSKFTKKPTEVPQQVVESVHALESLGLCPVIFPSACQWYGYLAGSDESRAQDLMDAFLDDSIDGIFCVRGGYGLQRILDKLDYNKISVHPKWFAGYSDITALHIMLNQRCGMITWHTPMPSTEIRKGLDDYTMKYLKMAMFGGMEGQLLPSCTPVEMLSSRNLFVPLDEEQVKEGTRVASGVLCGGNLSLVSSSLGTPYEIDTAGKILFLEDIDEQPYRIDGMMNHMRLAGKFRDAAGIILGYYTHCEAKDPKNSLTLEQVFRDIVDTPNKPVIINYSCGHDLPTMSLPLGAKVELRTDGIKVL